MMISEIITQQKIGPNFKRGIPRLFQSRMQLKVVNLPKSYVSAIVFIQRMAIKDSTGDYFHIRLIILLYIDSIYNLFNLITLKAKKINHTMKLIYSFLQYPKYGQLHSIILRINFTNENVFCKTITNYYYINALSLASFAIINIYKNNQRYRW